MNEEIKANFVRFEERWKRELASTSHALEGNHVYLLAFQRLVSLQGWRSELLQDTLSKDVIQFALEGQNDLLVSYLLARGGQWRASLQTTRSAIENYLNCFFFMDHPIENQLWENGKYKTSFSELFDYFSKHPKTSGLDAKIVGLDIIKAEYATLSKAVHASAKSFRMTNTDEPRIFVHDVPSLNKWDHRNRQVIRGLNLLMLSLFRDHLTTTRKKNLRRSISYALRKGDKDWIKKTYRVTIPFS